MTAFLEGEKPNYILDKKQSSHGCSHKLYHRFVHKNYFLGGEI